MSQAQIEHRRAYDLLLALMKFVPPRNAYTHLVEPFINNYESAFSILYLPFSPRPAQEKGKSGLEIPPQIFHQPQVAIRIPSRVNARRRRERHALERLYMIVCW